MPVLQTPRLTLRPPVAVDADYLFEMFSSWPVIQWLANPPWPYERHDMVSFLATTDEIYLVIVHGSRPIGAISWRQRPSSHIQAGEGPNVGYWLGEQWWGNGFMTEAAEAVCTQLFQDPAVDSIYSGYFDGNTASARIQARLGFEVAGHTKLLSRPRQEEMRHTNTVLRREAFRHR